MRSRAAARRLSRLVLVAMAVVLLLAGISQPAAAHARLAGSDPTATATIAVR